MVRRTSAWVLAGIVWLLAAEARAQPVDSATRDAARTLGISGVEAYQEGAYELASSRLEKAYALMRVPSIGLWSARALAKRNLLVEAAERYADVISQEVPQGDLAVQHQAQLDADAELQQLRPQIPKLTVFVTGAPTAALSLRIDGRAAAANAVGTPLPINAGTHHVEAEAGGVRKSASIEIGLGKTAAVTLDFGPPAPAATPSSLALTRSSSSPTPPTSPTSKSSPLRTLGWIGVGVGGAGVAAGSVFGILALSKRAALKSDGCSNKVCPPDKASDVSTLNTLRTLSTVGLVAGSAVAVTGVILLVSAPTGERSVSASLGPGSLALSGRF